MTELEAKQLVALLAASFPTPRFEQAELRHMSRVWHRVLAHVDYADAERAVVELCATSKFFPAVSEVLRIATGAGTHRRSGLEAWGDVLEAVSRYGAYRTPKFDDPAVAQVVRAMGWQELCASENQVADRARFVQAYEQVAERFSKSAALGRLGGGGAGTGRERGELGLESKFTALDAMPGVKS